MNVIHSNQSKTLEKNTLKKWFDELILPSFTFPHIKNNKSFGIQYNVMPLVQVIDCSQPDAIYQYDYKVSIYIHILIKVFSMNSIDLSIYIFWKVPGGKKPKKGKFNGYGSLTFSHLDYDNAKLYGVRNQKCLKISKRDLKSISGYFEQDVLMVCSYKYFKNLCKNHNKCVMKKRLWWSKY